MTLISGLEHIYLSNLSSLPRIWYIFRIEMHICNAFKTWNRKREGFPWINTGIVFKFSAGGGGGGGGSKAALREHSRCSTPSRWNKVAKIREQESCIVMTIPSPNLILFLFYLTLNCPTPFLWQILRKRQRDNNGKNGIPPVLFLN